MALKGINVVELAGLAPAPFCGMVMADFGATVIRVDKIHSGSFDCLGNGKKSISLNLKHREGTNVLKMLCKKADVLIEPFRNGVMEKLNLGPNVLLKENPRLIYARLTGYGQIGPYSNSAGHDINYVGLSGLLSLFGRYGENPMFPVNLAADFGGGGLMCALGILLALLERNNSGLGQVIDNNMVEGTSYLGSWLYRSQKLPVWGQERGKNILDSGAHFYEVYRTKDNKFMTVGALEPQFYDNLLKGLKLNKEEVPQFEDFDKSKELFTKIFLKKTQNEWCSIFENLDACVGPVLSLEDAPKHIHNRTGKSFVQTDEGFIPNPAPKLSRSPGVSKAVDRPPERGEHTREVMKMLGFSDDVINDLENDGAIECYKASKL